MSSNKILLNLSFFSYLIFTLFTINLEKRKHNLIISPYIIFTGGNLIVLIGCFTIGNIMNYYAISSILLLFIIFVSLLFFIVESSVLSFRNNINNFYDGYREYSSKIFENISIICISFEIFSLFWLILKFGIFGVITKQFTDVYAHGLSGHVLVFLQLSTVYYIGRIEKFQSKVICVLIILLELLVGVFHWVAFPIVAGVVYRIMLKKMKFTLGRLIFMGLLAIILFMASYGIFIIISAKINNQKISNETFLEIYGYSRHFFNYLFSGSLGGSVKIESGIMLKKQGLVSLLDYFMPVYNIVHILSGKYLSLEYFEMIIEKQKNVVHPGWDIVISDFGFKTNVEGVFGALYLNFSFSYTIVFIIILSMISNMLFVSALYCKSLFIKLYYSYFSVGLFFSWFTSFYSILEFYEIAGYLIFLYFGDKYISKKTIKILCH
jgi:hypothetical protein